MPKYPRDIQEISIKKPNKTPRYINKFFTKEISIQPRFSVGQKKNLIAINLR